MKTLFVSIIFCSLSLGVFAQQAASSSKSTASKTTVVSYRCPVCGYSSTKAGECPKDKTNLVKVGDYYCPECYMTSTKAEKCPMCGVPMKKMEASAANTSKK